MWLFLFFSTWTRDSVVYKNSHFRSTFQKYTMQEWLDDIRGRHRKHGIENMGRDRKTSIYRKSLINLTLEVIVAKELVKQYWLYCMNLVWILLHHCKSISCHFHEIQLKFQIFLMAFQLNLMYIFVCFLSYYLIKIVTNY